MNQENKTAAPSIEELVGAPEGMDPLSASDEGEPAALDIEDVDFALADTDLIGSGPSSLPQLESVDHDVDLNELASLVTLVDEAVLPTGNDADIIPNDMNERRREGRPVIVFDHVSKVYPAQPNRPALANISLEVYPGEFLFLVGHSGSGKSTFIRLLNRELIATNGRITIAGENISRLRRWRVPYLRRNIGCVFQDFKLLPNKTAFQNVAFALEVIGKSRHIIRTQVPEVLRLVGLEDKLNMLPNQLSGGEQQRVCIARAIVNRPPLLVCDEPTGNLDPQTSLGIMRLLDRINRTGTTVLVATHDREMVDSMRKRVVELENGYMVRDQDRGVYGIDG